MVGGRDPGTRQAKQWSLLHTCWDDVWDTICKNVKCFMLKAIDNPNVCVSTCKTYGGDTYKSQTDGCEDIYAANNCPEPRDPIALPPKRASGWGDSPPPTVFPQGCGAVQKCGGRARKKWCRVVKPSTCRNMTAAPAPAPTGKNAN